MSEQTARAPRHLWVVGVVAVLWNAIGAFDYSATQFRWAPYMSAFTQDKLDYFYGFPAWAVAAWAIAVWTSVAGSIGLLLRRRWSVWMFGASLAGMVITTVYNFVLTDGVAIMGSGAMIFSAVIWAIALFLFFYARAMAKRGVLA